MKRIEKQNKYTTVGEIIDSLNLISLTEVNREIKIYNTGIYRVGYEFAGFFQCEFDELYSHIHIIGKKEGQYLKKIPLNKRQEILEKYFLYTFPMIILTLDASVPEEFFEVAKKYNKAILKSNRKTSETIRELKFFLGKALGEELLLNGYVLLEIHGVGVLMIGDEDIKKGVTVELLERGHKFISDNKITVKKNEMNELVGYNMLNKVLTNPHFFIESAGEKVDITNHFGIKSTRTNKRIDMIIELERWKEGKFYDRLGLDDIKEKILGINLNKITLPVKKGRNVSVIIEAGAMNLRLKKMGVYSAVYFWKESQRLILENKNKKGSMQVEKKGLPIRKLIDNFKLTVLAGEEYIDEKFIQTTNLHKPSLALLGYFDMYEEEGYDGIQVFSEIEFDFMKNNITAENRDKNLKKYLSYDFPLIIVTSEVELPEYFIKEIIDSKLVLVRTDLEKAAQIVAIYNSYLETQFAKSVSMHGVLIELHGFGVLLTGKSGVGKSETALELIHRGHRLVADDLVKFKKEPDGKITGKADRLPYFMEVRGLGIIDIKTLYGLGAVRMDKRLDIIVELIESLTGDEYLTEVDYSEKVNIIDVPFDKVKLYITSGRNAAAMVEIAVMNIMAKRLGYDPEKAYNEGIDRLTPEEKIMLGV